ncbi:hypothetical protein T4B_2066 [Trichinella pseudospiralis]|uniref:Uncharacterized protein n=2 Tax=Trichinella pseudospiralis TaxID=6337 RepID=A0A0V1IZR2_TRIPS|nr:hypothetical protein T4A_4453 [Trichinella pseudospiralis]KRY87933.1 hypothetical protein T4D_7733 [Trichinella pseudospiralis]KRZ16536.1 hypothetical protein T4B_2066 [Trichinella pseudospiralis]KRZ28223.1 hypothetical protein T4C_11344 [Trichinella pseudospiralis]
MTHHLSLASYRIPPLIFKSKYITVADFNSDVVCDQLCLSSSSFAVSGIEQASSASQAVTISSWMLHIYGMSVKWKNDSLILLKLMAFILPWLDDSDCLCGMIDY